MNKNKPKIMHVLKSSIYSGAERVVVSIIKHLEREYDFLYVSPSGPIDQVLEDEGVVHVTLNKVNKNNVKKVVDEFKPDIIHAHDFSASVICASLKSNIYLISQIHYDPPWSHKWNIKSIIYALSAKQIDKMLTVSTQMYKDLVFSKQYQHKWQSIGNPIEIEKIKKQSECGHNNDIEQSDILFVGRLVWQKDPIRFLGIIARIKEMGWKDVKAIMLGEGELRSDCEKYIEKCGLQKNVTMCGYVKNPYEYMDKTMVLCITSHMEGYGLVAVEAGALEIPVLSTVTAGSLEIYGAGAEELCDTDEEFESKIQMMHNDEEHLRRLKRHSYEIAVKQNNIDDYMDCISGIYRRSME